MLILKFGFIEIFFVFVVIFIGNNCVRGDDPTTTKPPQTKLEPPKKMKETNLVQGLLNVTEAILQSLSNEGRTGTVKPQIKLTEDIVLNNTICDKNHTEICKIPLEIWNPDTCKCEQKVNDQKVIAGSGRDNSAASLLPQSLSPPATVNITSADENMKSDEISYRSPFMPRLG